MQSRSLSKQFKSLIDSSHFIADYNACESRPMHLLLRYHDRLYCKDSYYQFLSIADDNCFPQHNLTTPTPCNFKSLYHLRFVGCSNGLLCFHGDFLSSPSYEHAELAVIWNPSIEKYVEIEVPVLYDKYTYSCNNLAFGVHPDTNDPMLVNNAVDYARYYVEVFTLSSRVWRSARSNEPRKSIRFEGSQVAMDGFIYWHATDTINPGCAGILFSHNLIMSFNLRSEEFIEINLPDCLAPCGSNVSLSLSKLWKSLVLLQYYNDGEKRVCDIWKITNGVTKSFLKLFIVSLPLSSLKTILGFRKTGEPIIGKLMDGSKEQLELFATSIEDIKEYVINGQLGSFFVSSYKETLLLNHQKNYDYVRVNFESVSS